MTGGMVPTLAYLLLSLLAGLGFYLACTHQRLWAGAHARVRALRVGAWLCTSLALIVAVAAMGAWAGVFAVLTALMLVLVALPWLDAWRRLRNDVPEQRHVG